MTATFTDRVRNRLRRRHRVTDSPLLQVRQPSDVELLEHVARYDLFGVPVTVGDTSPGKAAFSVVSDMLQDLYDIHSVPFLPGDVVVDVGAHVGVFSLYVAQRHPEVTVYAFEPIAPSFELLRRNVARNGVGNVVPVNVALTADGRDLEMTVHLGLNSGGATAHSDHIEDTSPEHTRFRVGSVTLDDALDELGIERVKLLKIDSEGAEHEILKASSKLDRIEWVRGEFHTNPHLERQGHTVPVLVEHLSRSVDPEKIRYVECRMAD